MPGQASANKEPESRGETLKRGFRIGPRLLDRYGYTPMCIKCTNLSLGIDDDARHGAACRARLAKRMAEDEEDN